jgi:hypothetical protein
MAEASQQSQSLVATGSKVWHVLGILLGTATCISFVKNGFAIELHGLPAKIYQQYAWVRDMLFEPVVWVLRYFGLTMPWWLKDSVVAYGLVVGAHWRTFANHPRIVALLSGTVANDGGQYRDWKAYEREVNTVLMAVFWLWQLVLIMILVPIYHVSRWAGNHLTWLLKHGRMYPFGRDRMPTPPAYSEIWASHGGPRIRAHRHHNVDVPGLCGRQGLVEPRKDGSMAARIVHGHEASAEPNRSDALRHLFADARAFLLAANEFVGAAVDRAHSAPLGRGGVVPVDRVAGRIASKDVPCPMVWISNECAGFDQHLLLYGRGHAMSLFIGTPIDQVMTQPANGCCGAARMTDVCGWLPAAADSENARLTRI